MMRLVWFSTVFVVSLSLAACSQTQGRYSQRHDSAPTRLPSTAELQNAIPVQEPPSPQGNTDYQVLGQHYQVLESAVGFVEQGIASWYGNKFHGHLTANGEYYDMYSMTAAHKHLPLPTYVRVTNLHNEKSVIVRVNDRGPFHPDRIIDLSFAAAYKLDMLNHGTARVRVEAIEFKSPQLHNEFFIQLLASSDQGKMQNLLARLPSAWRANATTTKNNGLYKLMLGPYPQAQANRMLQQVRREGFPNAFRVKATTGKNLQMNPR